MSDKIYIWKFLAREFANDSPVIYLYASGSNRVKATALGRVMEDLTSIFLPAYTYEFLRKTADEFLQHKREAYIKGEIKIKPIY